MKFPILLIFLSINFYSNLLVAQEDTGTKTIEKSTEVPFDCARKLMSQPSCINRLNATNACKMFGGTPAAVTMIQKCVAKQGYLGGVRTKASSNILVLCLAGISGSNKVSDNETFCNVGDNTKSVSISESTVAKKIETSSDSKIEINNVSGK